MTGLPRIYWCTNVWIDLAQQTPGRIDRCVAEIDRARKNEIEIWTSTYTLAEAYSLGGGANGGNHVSAQVDAYFQQPFIRLVQVDRAIALRARDLLRAHSKLKKSPDAIHLATALASNCDELHTFDGKNLLPLNGSVHRRDGLLMKICEVPMPAQGALALGAANSVLATAQGNSGPAQS